MAGLIDEVSRIATTSTITLQRRNRALNVHEALAVVFESVFGPAAQAFSDEDGPGTVEAWDSVSHLNLILAIESEFGVEFATDEIPELLSVGAIRARLEQIK